MDCYHAWQQMSFMIVDKFLVVVKNELDGDWLKVAKHQSLSFEGFSLMTVHCVRGQVRPAGRLERILGVVPSCLQI